MSVNILFYLTKQSFLDDDDGGHHDSFKYKAVMICPDHAQYISNSPDNYDVSKRVASAKEILKCFPCLQNSIISQQGCYWRHVRLNNIPVYSHRYRLKSRKWDSNYLENLRLRHQPMSLYNQCC